MKNPFVLCLVLPILAAPALALDFAVKVEPAVAASLSSPQSDRFGLGAALDLKAMIGLGRYLDLVAGVGTVGLTAGASANEAGSALTAGGGLRLKRPHLAAVDRTGWAATSPWVEAEARYVRTGPLHRLGFDASVGLALPIDNARTYWIGPFVRYFQVTQGDRPLYDNRDAKIVTVGLSIEMDAVSGRNTASGVQPAADCPPDRECAAAEVPPDRDGDGIPDRFDRCPDVAGPLGGSGCPLYDKVVILEKKIELKEKIYFAWDRDEIEAVSHPLLDDVAKALRDNPSMHVQVEGHTDSTGAEGHNQTLSEGRAAAVVNYLVAHGVERSRLTSKGFSSSQPTDSNGTVVGRENNRRVEFVVELAIVDKQGGAK